MVFYRRDGHVIELQQTSNFAPAADEACHPNNFNPVRLPFITLISEFHTFAPIQISASNQMISSTAAAPKSGTCPYPGRYTVNGVAREGAKQSKRTGAASSNSRDAVCNEDLESLVVGCRDSKNLEFHSSCSSDSVSGMPISTHTK